MLIKNLINNIFEKYLNAQVLIAGVLLWFVGVLVVSSSVLISDKVIEESRAMSYTTKNGTFVKVSYIINVSSNMPVRISTKISCGELGEFSLNTVYTRVHANSTKSLTFLYEMPTILANSELCVATGYAFLNPALSITPHAVKLPMVPIVKAGEYEFLRDLALYTAN